MKKYFKEIFFLGLQLIIIYIYPLFAHSSEEAIMKLLFLSVLSLIIGTVSKEKIKFFYPVLSVILFMPEVWDSHMKYYQNLDMIYLVLVLVSSMISLFIGILIRWLIKPSVSQKYGVSQNYS